MALSLPAALESALHGILAMAERSGTPALVVAVDRFRQELERRQKPQKPLPGQLPLWEGDGKPWRGRLGPDVPVPCDHFGARGKPALIPLKTCLQRQAAKWPAKQAPIYEFCASQCAQGCDYKLRAAYSAEKDWASRSKSGSPRYQFYRKDAGVQRRKRRIFNRDEYSVPTIDAPPGTTDRPPAFDPDDYDVKALLDGGNET